MEVATTFGNSQENDELNAEFFPQTFAWYIFGQDSNAEDGLFRRNKLFKGIEWCNNINAILIK
jgi:hypothetical protein